MRSLRKPITSHEIRVWRSAKRPHTNLVFLSLSLSLSLLCRFAALLRTVLLLLLHALASLQFACLHACLLACLLFLSPSKSDLLAWIFPILKKIKKSRPASNFVLRRFLNFLSRDLRNLASMAISEAFGRFT